MLYVQCTYLSTKIFNFAIIFIVNFGANFKKCRNDCNLSQIEVAKRLNVCQSNISDWENDISRPEYEKLIELSKIYDVSVSELLGLYDK